MDGGVGLTLSAANDKLKYVKIGKQVTITGLLSVSSVTSSTNAVVVNLPYAVGGTVSDASGSAANQVMSTGMNTGDAGLAMYCAPTTSNAYFYKINNNAGWVRLRHSDLAASDEIYFSMSYFT